MTGYVQKVINVKLMKHYCPEIYFDHISPKEIDIFLN